MALCKTTTCCTANCNRKTAAQKRHKTPVPPPPLSLQTDAKSVYLLWVASIRMTTHEIRSSRRLTPLYARVQLCCHYRCKGANCKSNQPNSHHSRNSSMIVSLLGEPPQSWITILRLWLLLLIRSNCCRINPPKRWLRPKRKSWCSLISLSTSWTWSIAHSSQHINQRQVCQISWALSQKRPCRQSASNHFTNYKKIRNISPQHWAVLL